MKNTSVLTWISVAFALVAAVFSALGLDYSSIQDMTYGLFSAEGFYPNLILNPSKPFFFGNLLWFLLPVACIVLALLPKGKLPGWVIALAPLLGILGCIAEVLESTSGTTSPLPYVMNCLLCLILAASLATGSLLKGNARMGAGIGLSAAGLFIVCFLALFRMSPFAADSESETFAILFVDIDGILRWIPLFVFGALYTGSRGQKTPAASTAYAPPAGMPVAAAFAQPSNQENLESIGQLKELYDAGALTQEEFTTAKKQLLGL